MEENFALWLFMLVAQSIVLLALFVAAAWFVVSLLLPSPRKIKFYRDTVLTTVARDCRRRIVALQHVRLKQEGWGLDTNSDDYRQVSALLEFYQGFMNLDPDVLLTEAVRHEKTWKLVKARHRINKVSSKEHKRLAEEVPVR